MTVDHDALRVKYREERDKRLRPDGNDQYIEPTGRFASMLDDPYADESTQPFWDAALEAFKTEVEKTKTPKRRKKP